VGEERKGRGGVVETGQRKRREEGRAEGKVSWSGRGGVRRAEEGVGCPRGGGGWGGGLSGAEGVGAGSTGGGGAGWGGGGKKRKEGVVRAGENIVDSSVGG